ncbi:hypothetical protein BST61_g8554 [Cercospora zeina]
MSTPDRAEQRGLLNDASPALAAGTATPTLISPRDRPGYTRVPTISFSETPPTVAPAAMAEEEERSSAPCNNQDARQNHGLGIISQGIRDQQAQIRPATPQQGAQAGNSSRIPDQSYIPYSAPSTGPMTGSTKFEESFDISYNPKHASRTSFQSGTPSIYAKSDAGLLSVRTAYNEFAPQTQCPSKKAYKHGRFSNWISMTILTLAIFSTAFSLIFVIIALRGPKYGRAIRNGGNLTPSSAAFLTSFFAKLIELSFVTVVVAFIGQALARRAFKLERARGITLAELNMRAWILQPGTMLTQWESVRYAGISFLGIVSFLAALFAILYTSAATALVQPQLVLPGFENRVLQGIVKSQYANVNYIGENCKTPIASLYDQEFNKANPDVSKTTCLQIEYAASAYGNLHSYLGTWRDHSWGYGNSTNQLQTRPPGYAQFNGNTTVSAPWIERTEVNQTAFQGYIINNVTMAMPHVGVVQAATDPANDIMQPSEVQGALYNIRASVPSPMVNVLCLTMNETALGPFVYNTWDRNTTACNETDWVTNGAWPRCADWNGTRPDLTNWPGWDKNLEDIFHWGDKWGPSKNPPMFPHLPKDYNTVVNDTIGLAGWGATSVYLLLKGGPTDVAGNPTSATNPNYALCQLQAGLTPTCYSSYNASISGGTMEAVCESGDRLQFDQSVPDATKGNDTLSKDWPNIAGEWARSLSLNAGLFSGNASNARLLSQLIVTSPANLSTTIPSTAEALAVLAGNTLIQSAMDSPFTMFWNYTNPTMDGSPQYFNASVRIQQYASGGSAAYQKPFHVVLVAVFLMNVAILSYFFCHRDWYTDFSEPVHLFSLAVNSPPSYELAGSCGSGPSGEMYKTSWKLHRDGEHFYVDSQKQSGNNTMEVDSPRFSRRRLTQTFEMGSPMGKFKDRFSRQ